MPSSPRVIASALGVTIALAIGGSVASASAAVAPTPAALTVPDPLGSVVSSAAGACNRASGPEGVGSTGSPTNLACGVLTFLGPATGQIASVIGPTVIGPVSNLVILTSAGSANSGATGFAAG